MRRHTVPRRQRRTTTLLRATSYAVLFTAGPVLLGIGAGVDLAPDSSVPVLARIASNPPAATDAAPVQDAAPEATIVRGKILAPQRDRRRAAERTRRAVRAERRVLADLGTVPGRAVTAYRRAARTAPCTLDWTLVAAIGLVETDHGRYGGAHLTPAGVAVPEIRGPALTGSGGFALVPDTDRGRVDGDTVHDRAVGPMQFIPSTWSWAGADGDGNGTRDPHDIDDAAAAAAGYLCRGGGDLTSVAGRRAAVFTYNQSEAYVDAVLGVAASYAAGNYTAVAVVASPDDEAEEKPKKRKKRRHRQDREDRPRPGRHTEPGTPDRSGPGGSGPDRSGPDRSGPGRPTPTPRPTPRPTPSPTPTPSPSPSETPSPGPEEPAPSSPDA